MHNAFFCHRYIIDSGFVKQLNHNSRVGMDILEVVPISQCVFFLNLILFCSVTLDVLPIENFLTLI